MVVEPCGGPVLRDKLRRVKAKPVSISVEGANRSPRKRRIDLLELAGDGGIDSARKAGGSGQLKQVHRSRNAVGPDVTENSTLGLRREHQVFFRDSVGLTGLFIIDKEEELVLPERSPDASAEIVLQKLGDRQAVRVIKPRIGV